jgi:diguanylate cyclase (GGDEF)-like protein/PAS domain S-box-containing protein
MIDRTELLEAALDRLPDGIVLLAGESQVVYWNHAAETITGYQGVDLLARPIPKHLQPMMQLAPGQPALDQPGQELQDDDLAQQPDGEAMVRVQHKLGHKILIVAQTLVLRDRMGARIGTAVIFHSAESLDALPHGECVEGSSVESRLAGLELRLGSAYEDFTMGGMPFGVMWITVDQAYDLRKTHGASACEAMLGKMERVLANGLRPAEVMGRWGDDEFLVLSHERTPAMLADHAQMLAGVARTTDFRWWGDRHSLTVSIGVAQVEQNETLAELLGRAKAAMFSSFHAGGNHVTAAPGRHACLPS